MFDSNVGLTNALLEEARHVDYRSFVYLGSSAEYGRCNAPIREDQRICPTNRYEATKGCGSLLCLAEAALGRPVVVIRPFSVYGPGEAHERFIPTLYRCWKNGHEMSLGPGVHDWIYVDDLVLGIQLVSFAPPEVLRGQVVNLGSGVQNSNEEVVRMFVEIAGPVIVRRVASMRTYDSDCWVADITHARETFGFHPRYDLQRGLRAYVAEQATNPSADCGHRISPSPLSLEEQPNLRRYPV